MLWPSTEDAWLTQSLDWPFILSVSAGIALAVAICVAALSRRRGPPESATATDEQPDVFPPLNREFAGSRDGAGAGDHDRPFSFGRRPRALWPYPFTTQQYARLLLLRGRWQDGLVSEEGQDPLTPALSQGAQGERES
jgi:hypothetical protein